MLALHVVSAVGLSGPSSLVESWRTARLTKWSRTLDQRFDSEYRYKGRIRDDLRYRTQILIVDGDGNRARICESILDKLCESVDADVDSMSSSIGTCAPHSPARSLIDASTALELSTLPLKAPLRPLHPKDLLAASRWDVIVCTDTEICERVRALARAANVIDSNGGTLAASDGWADEESQLLQWGSHRSGIGTDASVLCLTDFLASCVPPFDCGRLPDPLRALFSPQQLGDRSAAAIGYVQSLVDLPTRAAEAVDEDETVWDEVCGAAAICCAGLIAYLEAVMREHATRSFLRDLHASFGRPPHLARGVPWATARKRLSVEHGVPGGLDEEERCRLYEEMTRPLSSAGAETKASVRVDVSDLGLTMDDLSNPMGDTDGAL